MPPWPAAVGRLASYAGRGRVMRMLRGWRLMRISLVAGGRRAFDFMPREARNRLALLRQPRKNLPGALTPGKREDGRQPTTLAGSNWTNGVKCGAGARNANNSQVAVNANYACRGQAPRQRTAPEGRGNSGWIIFPCRGIGPRQNTRRSGGLASIKPYGETERRENVRQPIRI
jgi:hypothetical protein